MTVGMLGSEVGATAGTLVGSGVEVCTEAGVQVGGKVERGRSVLVGGASLGTSLGSSEVSGVDDAASVGKACGSCEQALNTPNTSISAMTSIFIEQTPLS
jgi:hypothetical protein